MINKIFKNKYILTVMQFVTLTVFMFLIYGAIGVYTDDATFAKVLRNTNLPNLIVWSYWWPIIISIAIIFGRFWCSICPMELITSFFGKLGLRKKPSRILKSAWIVTLLYAIILVVGIHTLKIHRVPAFMAVYMLSLLSLAVIVGLIWEKRTFCSYFCPVGHLLSFYSLLSFFKIGVKDSDKCKTCKTKSCISKENSYKFIGRSCTSGLYPAKMKENGDCILCGQCFKSCSRDNMILKRKRLSTSALSNMKLSWAEIVFFFIVSSFVVYEILSQWKVTDDLLMYVPSLVNDFFGITGKLEGTIKAIVLFIITPFIFYSLLGCLKKYFSKQTWKDVFSSLVLAILPITACMHLFKALLKTTSRIPYWRFAISDMEGVNSAKLIINNSELLSSKYLNSVLTPILSVLAFVLIFIGLSFSIYMISKQKHINKRYAKQSNWISILAVLIYACLFILSLICVYIY